LAKSASYKDGKKGCSLKVYISWRMKLKKSSSGVLRKSEAPLYSLWHLQQNI
jgi:hypothetical protein